MIIDALQWVSALCALVAAGFWLKSARIRTPSSFPISVVRPDSFGLPLGEPLGATYVGFGHSPAMNELGEALRKQSKWSAIAALAAAFSAACQAVSMISAALE